MANRFSQIVQPHVVNPISMEKFSVIPMAKAAERAAGIRATGSMKLDYNVDQKDRNLVQSKVAPIIKGKEAITEEFMTNGVSASSISEFIELNKQYQDAKRTITAAETRKKEIDIWKQNVLRMHGTNPDLLNRVMQKEYEEGYQGTFGTGKNGETVINPFNPGYGPKAYNIQDDFTENLKGIKMSLDEKHSGGASGKMIKVPDGEGGTKWAYQTTQGKKVYSNEEALLSRMNSLTDSYKDKETSRGKYAEYMGMDYDYIEGIANSVKDSYLQTDTRGGTVKRQVLEDSPTPADAIPNYTTVDTKWTMPEANISAEIAAEKNKRHMGIFKKTTKKVPVFLMVLGKAISSRLFGPSFGISGTEADMMIAASNSYESSKLDRVATKEEVADATNELVADYAMDAQNAMDAGAADGMPPYARESYINSINEIGANIGTYEDDQVKLARKNTNVIESLYTESLSYTNYTTPIMQEGALETRDKLYKEKFIGNEVLRDISKGIVEGNSEFAIYDITNRKLLKGGSAAVDLTNAIKEGTGNVGKVVKGGWGADFVGTTTADYKTYVDANGNPVKGIAYGNLINLIKYDINGGVVSSTRVLVGPKVGVRQTELYRQDEAKLYQLGKMELGVPHDAMAIINNKNIKVELEKTQIAMPVVTYVKGTNGELTAHKVWANPGDMVIHVDGSRPILYTADFFGNINNISTKPSEGILTKRTNDIFSTIANK